MFAMSVLPKGCLCRAGLGLWFLWLLLNLLFCLVNGVNQEGWSLLALKNFVTDPLSVLGDWKIESLTPCGWNGVTCSHIPGSKESKVISLVLPNARMMGTIPQQLGFLKYLRHLDLSGNEINGTIPPRLFNARELQNLVLANNAISGILSPHIQQLQKLQHLDLSNNALTGIIPPEITSLKELKTISLKNNYFKGPIPRGLGSNLGSLKALDFSSNILNESIPPDLGNLSSLLSYLNLSRNWISGTIPPTFGHLSRKAIIDLSNNNLTGPIPHIGAFMRQKPESFTGNSGLCGKPLTKLCSSANPPKLSSPSAIAVNPVIKEHKVLSKGTIFAIVMGDLAGISIVCAVLTYRFRKRKEQKEANGGPDPRIIQVDDNGEFSSSPGRSGCFCLKKMDGSSEGSRSENGDQQRGTFVALDGDLDLNLDKLLRASAYILGASGYSIIYKAVLEDGLTYAVRRLGDGGLEGYKDFEMEARAIGRIKHRNIVRLRGYYCGKEEKLLIYDCIPNGSLANTYYGRSSNSPCYLPWAARLRIAKGVARGLAYLHEKKLVHGNLKPSNILLGFDMEPYIADFGLNSLLDTANVRYSSSALQLKNFEGALSASKRSTGSRDSLQTTPELLVSPSTSKHFASPYQAPEALKTLRPYPQWDVYSYGVILLEMLTGKPPSDKDFITLGQSVLHDRQRLMRMVEPTLRLEMEGREEVSICLRIAFNCSSASPHKRPSMKEVLHILEKIPSSWSSSLTMSSDQ